ncbi:MAG: EAL domain-containing protein [Erysipelotrichaceae bacterium]|nr:EAL domain-containing protein [Erysipelotrichaceae bacterium]
MLYSSAGLLALIVSIIINHDVLFGRNKRSIVPARKEYRVYLANLLAYYITDILWGILYENHLIRLNFLDTALYFFFMGSSIFMWTRYVVAYLNEEKVFGRLLKSLGWLFFGFETLIIVLNFFFPILFSFDEAGVYHAEGMRYLTLAVQLLMFVITAVYAFFSSKNCSGAMKSRHFTIGTFSFSMVGFIIVQVLYPLLPLYAIGCMLGTCVLHSFVLENEKEEYRGSLEQRLKDNVLKGNYYDLLTGLPGMTYFFDLVDSRRKQMFKENKNPAFLFFDLNGLKYYNLHMGFSKGDRLLQNFSSLLTKEFGEDNCSRFGQDRFVAFAEEEGLVDRIKKLFADWESNKEEYLPSIRAGIYLDKFADVDIWTACDRAKLARDTIRKSYNSNYRFFDFTMEENAEMNLYITSHLEQAMVNGWIKLYYQPIVRATNGRVCDEEALARWDDPVHGFLTPDKFIPILEDSGLIYKLDLYVVENVLKKLVKQKESGLYLVPQSINLSRSDFDSCDIVTEICRRVDEYGIAHNLLTIEITESLIGSDFEFIKQQVDRFRALDFPVWLDDFGSGYSSLDILQTMEIDLIKFDMRFMQQFDHDDKDKIVLTELMKLAIGLGIDTICEGVETKEQVSFLKEIGCAKLQGYYYTKPLPLEKIFERYENGTQIGFENPEESLYYNMIDKINLYDLAVLTKENQDNFRNYFNTVPMAILEVRGNKACFTRSNQTYRDFMKNTFNIDISELSGTFDETPEGPGLPFVLMLRKCCEEGGLSIFREKLPDGSIITSFMRKIAYNEVTDTTAAAVAVLTVNSEAKENLIN